MANDRNAFLKCKVLYVQVHAGHPQPYMEEESFATKRTLEKMGALMDENCGRQLGVTMSWQPSLHNLYKKGSVTDSHDLPVFLQLYNGHPWSRKTG